MSLVRVASDLHLEQWVGRSVQLLVSDHLPPDPRDDRSVLVLAGDISSNQRQLVDFLQTVETRFRHVVYVPGNHEYYRHDLTEYAMALRASIQEATHRTTAAIDEVVTVDADGLRFIAGTLWADGGLSAEEERHVGDGLADFYVIRLDGRPYTVADMQARHARDSAAFERLLGVPRDRPVVAVSHHMPSRLLCHPRFGTQVNGGFAGRCDRLLCGALAPTLWVHGHTHDTLDQRLGDTRIVCNPSGYRRETRQSAFNDYGPKFVEL